MGEEQNNNMDKVEEGIRIYIRPWPADSLRTELGRGEMEGEILSIPVMHF